MANYKLKRKLLGDDEKYITQLEAEITSLAGKLDRVVLWAEKNFTADQYEKLMNVISPTKPEPTPQTTQLQEVSLEPMQARPEPPPPTLKSLAPDPEIDAAMERFNRKLSLEPSPWLLRGYALGLRLFPGKFITASDSISTYVRHALIPMASHSWIRLPKVASLPVTLKPEWETFRFSMPPGLDDKQVLQICDFEIAQHVNYPSPTVVWRIRDINGDIVRLDWQHFE